MPRHHPGRIFAAVLLLTAGLGLPAAGQAKKSKKGATPAPAPEKKAEAHPAAGHVVRGPYLQNPTQTSIVICWGTPDPCRGEVRWGPGRALKEKIAETSDTVDHQVVIQGLTPGTAYAFQVADGEFTSAAGTFETFPAKTDAPFSFLAYGDTRSGHDVHRQVVKAMAQRGAKFAIHSGDLVASGSSAALWDTFFDINRDFLFKVPLFATQGNHEHGAKLFFDRLVMPGNEKWYSFRYANALFLCLDAAEGPRRDGGQLGFLATALKENADAEFVFPFFHNPILTCTTLKDRQKDTKDLYEAWGKIFEDAKVTVAIGGHNHNYQRAEKNGVQYVTSGGGGAELYAIGDKLPETKVAVRTHHYSLITIRGKHARWETYDLTGKVIDSLDLPARR